MPNKRYIKGRKFEYRVKNYLESCGYLVFRTAGSHGIADLIAFNGDSVPFLIQCKAGEGIETKKEMDNFRLVAYKNHTIPVLATTNKKAKLLFSVVGEKPEEIKF